MQGRESMGDKGGENNKVENQLRKVNRLDVSRRRTGLKWR